ncbi:unnamed protein product [Fraxinus pennsylvanica]|uniref:Uncharacterized protein n=1 Tax=Fraxinus pennsylvanica TaxID=56036 RepID=A0AAD1ZVT0_9LAMI|nr:unnamed protein product [Fraxinus pennsylvanica]
MSRSPVELDFFRMEWERNRDSSAAPISERKRSFRGIVSKLNPEIVKSAIQPSTFGANKSLRLETHTSYSPLILHEPNSRSRPSYGRNDIAATEQTTIFDFDLFTQKKLADEEKVPKSAEYLNAKLSVILYEQDLLGTLEKGFLPYARRISVKKFLEKRKERRLIWSCFLPC